GIFAGGALAHDQAEAPVCLWIFLVEQPRLVEAPHRLAEIALLIGRPSPAGGVLAQLGVAFHSGFPLPAIHWHLIDWRFRADHRRQEKEQNDKSGLHGMSRLREP